MARAELKKTPYLLVGGIALSVGVPLFLLALTERVEFGLSLIALIFCAFGCWMFWVAFRKTPELEITTESISVQGFKFDRRTIKNVRVCEINSGEGGVRCLVLHFLEGFPLPLKWKLHKFTSDHGLPARAEDGRRLPPEPRIIFQLNDTDLSDDQINNIIKCEQTDAVNPSPRVTRAADAPRAPRSGDH